MKEGKSPGFAPLQVRRTTFSTQKRRRKEDRLVDGYVVAIGIEAFLHESTVAFMTKSTQKTTSFDVVGTTNNNLLVCHKDNRSVREHPTSSTKVLNNIISIINNLALLLALGIIYEVSYSFPARWEKRVEIVKGLLIGLISSITSTYQPIYAPWLGPNFENVVPYLVMILVLLIRPYGLYGTKEVQRV